MKITTIVKGATCPNCQSQIFLHSPPDFRICVYLFKTMHLSVYRALRPYHHYHHNRRHDHDNHLFHHLRTTSFPTWSSTGIGPTCQATSIVCKNIATKGYFPQNQEFFLLQTLIPNHLCPMVKPDDKHHPVTVRSHQLIYHLIFLNCLALEICQNSVKWNVAINPCVLYLSSHRPFHQSIFPTTRYWMRPPRLRSASNVQYMIIVKNGQIHLKMYSIRFHDYIDTHLKMFSICYHDYIDTYLKM